MSMSSGHDEDPNNDDRYQSFTFDLPPWRPKGWSEHRMALENRVAARVAWMASLVTPQRAARKAARIPESSSPRPVPTLRSVRKNR
jgi:hypothetical protein